MVAVVVVQLVAWFVVVVVPLWLALAGSRPVRSTREAAWSGRYCFVGRNGKTRCVRMAVRLWLALAGSG